MSDFERRLRNALRAVGDAYEPSDEARARERFLARRRRRRTMWAGGAALAGAAALVVALLFYPGRTVPDDDSPAEVAVRPVVAAVIDTGDEPFGVVHAEGALWVADRAGGAVWRIDPRTNDAIRIEVAGGPDDLIAAAGALWVVHPDADVLTRIDARRAEVVDELAIPGSGAHLDVARAAGALWLLEEGGRLLRFDAAAGTFADPVQLPDDPTDVAIAGGKMWIYARGAGEVRQLDPETAEAAGPPALVGTADEADLAAGLGAVWFYGDGDGKLVRIDGDTAAVDDEIALGGAYAGLAVGEGAVWAVVGDGEGRGSLYQIDAATVRPRGAPVPLAGRPLDVDVSFGAVWVTNAGAGTVTRLDLVPASGEVAETEEPPATVPYASVAVYVSDGKDVVAVLRDGTQRRIAATAAPELYPAVSRDGSKLVLQRGAGSTAEPAALVEVDLATGRTEEVARGASPAFVDDTLTWLEAEAGGAAAQLRLRGDATTEGVAVPLETPSALAWSRNGERVALEAGPASARRVYAAAEPDALLSGGGPSGVEWIQVGDDDIYADASVFSPLPDAAGVYVLRACCRGDDGAFETLELGFVEDDGSFTRIKGLDDFGLDPNAGPFSLAPAGGLDYEADAGWRIYEDRAWFVSDGRTLVLVDENAEVDLIPVDGAYGIAANPLNVED